MLVRGGKKNENPRIPRLFVLKMRGNLLMYFYLLLFAFFHLGLQSCESVEVTERSSGSNIVDLCLLFFLCRVLASWLNIVLAFLECAAVAEDDALCLFHEFDHLEWEFLTELSL